MSKRDRGRTPDEVVADLSRTDLPEQTIASRGTPADPADEQKRRKLRKGEVHPYRPDEIDEWLRERLDEPQDHHQGDVAAE